jgi:hypothetical protein
VLQSESSENSALELQLDIDELQELHALCTQSPIRNYLQHLLTHLDKVRTNYCRCFSNNPEEKRKWSDIVAGRNPHASKTTAQATHAIETVITTGPSHLRRGPQKKGTNKKIQPTSVRKGQYNQQINKPKIVIVGDSHARGVAGEILHQSNCHIKPIGYVKPNSELAELINTANNVSSNITNRDTLVLIGGSNDIDKNIHSQNITSIARFLQDTRNTNIILTEVPARYDVGARTHINADIERYNQNLRKVIKEYQHVSLISITHNREFFTKHGLHLNNTGKELLSKVILRILAVKRNNKKVTTIELPCEIEPSRRSDRNRVMKDFSSQTDSSLTTLPTPGQEITNTATDDHSVNPSVPARNETTSDQRRNEDKNQVNLGVREKNDPTENHSDNIQVQDDSSRQQEKEAVMIATRRSRKTPVTRSEDFLWATTSKIQAR